MLVLRSRIDFGDYRNVFPLADTVSNSLPDSRTNNSKGRFIFMLSSPRMDSNPRTARLRGHSGGESAELE